jgi:5'-nucleotidase/UDP-sugar diphosphatase
VLSIHVGNAPLDDSKIYKLATNDFMARGNDGYTMFRDAKRLVTDVDGPLISNEVMAYLRKLGTVKTGIQGRIVFK